MTLYEFTPSRSTRVRWLLEELGVKFDAVPVDLMAGEHKGAGFLSVNPAGKVPVLVDGDLVLTETMAIVLYLAEKDEQRRFLPTDRAQRAQVYRWLSFTITELEQPLWRMRRHTKLYAVERRLAAEVDLAREDFAAMARVLEAHMHERPFVVGPTVSVADFVLAWTLDWAHANALLEHSPNLLAYLERMYRRAAAPSRMRIPSAPS